MKNQFYTEISFTPTNRKPVEAYCQQITRLMKRQTDDDMNSDAGEFSLTFTFKKLDALKRAIHRLRTSHINVKIHTCHEYEDDTTPYVQTCIEELSNRSEHAFLRMLIKKNLKKKGQLTPALEKY